MNKKKQKNFIHLLQRRPVATFDIIPVKRTARADACATPASTSRLESVAPRNRRGPGRRHLERHRTGLSELDRAADQIEQYLMQPGWIANQTRGHIGSDRA